MALKSSSEKAKMKKKIFKKEQSTTVFNSKQFTFFGGTAFIFLVMAGFTFFSTDFQNREKQSNQTAKKQPAIDFTTTASVGRSSPFSSTGEINVTQRRTKDFEAQEKQRRKIDDLTRIIQRLRNEQASLNNRVVELDSALEKNSKQLEKLQRKLNLAEDKISKSQAKEPVKLPIVQSSVLTNPERTEIIAPKTVAVRKIPLSSVAQKSQNFARASTPSKPGPSSKNQIDIAKTTPLSQQQIDKTIVSSISRVDKAEFAIDLGINPTKERAEDLWKTLKKRYPDDLSILQPSFIKTGSTNQETRLIAGPFADASDAIQLCVQLKVSKNYCKTTLMPK